MFLDVFAQVTLVKRFEPANVTRIVAFFAHMFAQNVGAKMGHDGELGPTVSTSVLFDQFGHVVNFGLVENQAIGGTGFVLAGIAKEKLLSLLFTALNVVIQFGLHVGFEVTKIAGVFILLKVNSDLK